MCFDDDVVEKLKVYLINHNDEDYQFHYKLLFAGDEHLSWRTRKGNLIFTCMM